MKRSIKLALSISAIILLSYSYSIAGTVKYSVTGLGLSAGLHGTLEIDEFGYNGVDNSIISNTFLEDAAAIGHPFYAEIYYVISNCNIYSSDGAIFINQGTGRMWITFDGTFDHYDHSSWSMGDVNNQFASIVERDVEFEIDNVLDYDQLSDLIYLRNGMYINDPLSDVEYHFNLSRVPVPATFLLFASSLIGLAGFRKKLQK